MFSKQEFLKQWPKDLYYGVINENIHLFLVGGLSDNTYG